MSIGAFTNKMTESHTTDYPNRTIKTWPLISLAATYSERVYESPRGPERSTHVDADWKTGAKAMTIKSVANTTFKAIVFAIRGTSSFMDWVVNLNTAPTSPNGFLVSRFCRINTTS